MANTPKKKTASSSARSGGKSTAKRRSAPPPPAYNAQARIIGGIVCLLLALCVLVTYFNVDAILLTFLANVLKGCVGYGYWLAAPALLYAGILLVNHKGCPVKLRLVCTLLLLVLVGMVLHLLLARGTYGFDLEHIKPMWKDGQSLLCGGVVSGSLAVGMEALLSRVVSLILTILLTLLAVLGAPALIKLGADPLPAHLFILYFGCMSTITPPVALSTYAAAGISGGSPMKTGIYAMKLASVAFLIPYIFVYGQELLLYGSLGSILLAILSASLGCVALAGGMIGWLGAKMPMPLRFVLVGAAITLMIPGALTDVIGVVLMAACVITAVTLSKRQTPKIQ